MSEQAQPQTIVLNNQNSIEILVNYIEVAQKNGAFLLPESEVLKRCKDFLLKNVSDNELTVSSATNLLIQGINKGQKAGSYTLDDAYVLHRVCTYVSQNLNEPVNNGNGNDDLNSLSDPVPLKTGPRTI
jgi:hypothetical protein